MTAVGPVCGRGVLGRGGEGARRDVVDEDTEGLDRRFEVPGVERQRGLTLCDVEAGLCDHVALVDARGDHVPRDAVAVLTVDERPRRGVESCVTGQRPVVEVDRALRGQRDHRVGQQGEVRDGEQPLEGVGGQLGLPVRDRPGRIDHGQLLRGRPVGDPARTGGHCDDLVALAEQGLAALDEQAVGAHEGTTDDGMVGGAHRATSGVARRGAHGAGVMFGCEQRSYMSLQSADPDGT